MMSFIRSYYVIESGAGGRWTPKEDDEDEDEDEDEDKRTTNGWEGGEDNGRRRRRGREKDEHQTGRSRHRVWPHGLAPASVGGGSSK